MSALRRGGCPDSAIFETGGELVGVAGRREAGLAGADDGERLIEREMGKRFFECASESGELHARSEAQDRFAEAKYAVGCFFEGLGGGIA